MPHIILEYSANILDPVQPDLFQKMHSLLAEAGPFIAQNMLSRAVRHEIYCVGNGEQDRAFVHLQLAMMPGRSMEIKCVATARMLAFLQESFSRSCKQLRCTITVEVRELEKESYVRETIGER